MSRNDELKSGKLAEHLINKLINGTITRSKGFDITKGDIRIEVRSRTKFTDGKTPRATVNKSKMTSSDVISFVQFNNDAEKSIASAVLIDTKNLDLLYQKYRQINGVAHIPFDKVFSHPKSMDITNRLIAIDNNSKIKDK